MNIKNLENNARKYVSSLGNFHVLEYQSDASVAPENARNDRSTSATAFWC